MPLTPDDVANTLIERFANHYGRYVLVDRVNSNLSYIGVAEHGALTSEAHWHVKRVQGVGSLITVESAPRQAFDNIWDDRTTLFPAAAYTNTYSVIFDGVNDYITCGNNYTFEISQAFSVSMWVKPNNLAATRCLVSKCSNDANVYGWNIQHIIVTGAIQLQMRSSGGTFPIHAFTSALTAGVWQHVVVTYAGGSNINGARCYRNSVIGDTPASSSLTGTFANTANFTLGARNTAFPYSGHMDEVMVWNKALSQAEVTELYNGGTPFDPIDHSAYGNLLSYWRMGDGDTYPTIFDNDTGGADGTMTNMTAGSIVADVP